MGHRRPGGRCRIAAAHPRHDKQYPDSSQQPEDWQGAVKPRFRHADGDRHDLVGTHGAEDAVVNEDEQRGEHHEIQNEPQKQLYALREHTRHDIHGDVRP